MNRKYTTLITLLFTYFFLMTSCVDDMESCLDDVPEEIINGYSLTLTVTLDQMGGTRADKDGPDDPLKDIDDYIDPEKFRVLFFDDMDKFLFESKSRWVKQLAPTADGFSQWLVSIPMFAYGNDVTYDWPWEEIREKISKNQFKIAILANRPTLEWYPGFSETWMEQTSQMRKNQWIDNTGPHWTVEDIGVKTVFDLHHCQYDILYHAKGGDGNATPDLYDFIMGNYGKDEDGKSATNDKMRPMMGATSSWVYWGPDPENTQYDGVSFQDEKLDPDFPSDAKVKYTVMPDSKHPIPMYGIQLFEPIGDYWIKGTPFNLSNITTGSDQTGYEFRSISLLRSLVRLELLISKSYFNDKKPQLVTLWYPNIYSRCEPMNVWDPTNEIWEDDHEKDCEWNTIMDYGLVCGKSKIGNTTRNTTGTNKVNFQKTMSWFYGAWKEKGPDGKPRWTFPANVDPFESVDYPYPKIFNSCIQRNKTVICNIEGDKSDLYDDGYWHYVVYTGERNMIDPNKVAQLSGTAYAISWMFKDGRTSGKATSKYYFIPIADYSQTQTYARGCFGPYLGSDIANDTNTGSTQLPNNDKGKMRNYANDLRDNVINDRKEMPWPLLRNHIYRIKIGPGKDDQATRAGAGSDLLVTSEDLHSESLTPQ